MEQLGLDFDIILWCTILQTVIMIVASVIWLARQG